MIHKENKILLSLDCRGPFSISQRQKIGAVGSINLTAFKRNIELPLPLGSEFVTFFAVGNNVARRLRFLFKIFS
jgi:hypothetical protein